MTDDWVTALAAERGTIGRTSASEAVADVLRTRIIEGHLAPGTRLSEQRIGTALGVSRNTLRESFHLLGHERLVVHEFNRGVFVRTLGTQDVQDLYRFRRILEVAAIRHCAVAPADLSGLRTAVDEGEAAAAVEDWRALGSANMHFHKELAAFAGSLRVDEAMRQVLAEMRLVFATMADPRTFHEPYLQGNGTLVRLLDAGDHAGAERALLDYLDRAEAQLLAALDADAR